MLNLKNQDSLVKSIKEKVYEKHLRFVLKTSKKNVLKIIIKDAGYRSPYLSHAK